MLRGALGAAGLPAGLPGPGGPVWPWALSPGGHSRGVTGDRSQDTGERPIPAGNKGSSNARG